MSEKRYALRSGFGERPFWGIDVDSSNDSRGSTSAGHDLRGNHRAATIDVVRAFGG
ncbi:hypothetical protein [Rhodanobacter ginsengiterrae]|uniref:hypothetical protein n=1 Tax=Rhodanobacter ginsengiterrae TaxID=2008451 RepID=UPI003CEE561D